MKRFRATVATENDIELDSSDQMEELYNTLDKDDNFILEWMEGRVLLSKLMIANNMNSKVKNGEITIRSKEA